MSITYFSFCISSVDELSGPAHSHEDIVKTLSRGSRRHETSSSSESRTVGAGEFDMVTTAPTYAGFSLGAMVGLALRCNLTKG